VITATAGLVTAVAGLIVAASKLDGCRENHVDQPTPRAAEVVLAASPTIAPPAARPTATPIDLRTAAEALGRKYCEALIHRDFFTLLESASMPFAVKSQVFNTPAELNQMYDQMFHQKPPAESIEIQDISSRTIAEWRSQGFDLSKERVAKALNLPDDTYVSWIKVGNRDITIYYRMSGDRLTVAGYEGS